MLYLIFLVSIKLVVEPPLLIYQIKKSEENMTELLGISQCSYNNMVNGKTKLGLNYLDVNSLNEK